MSSSSMLTPAVDRQRSDARPSATIRVALAGNPNTGKTALFNALTGSRCHVANYPGVTVEKRWGTALAHGARLEVLDLPGAYSLDAQSLDERVARDVLCGQQAGTPRPDVAVVLLDPFHLERSLYVALQIVESGCPTVLAVNFLDEVRRQRLRLDVRRWDQRIPCPVVPVSALTGEGLEALVDAVRRAAAVGADGASVPWRRPEAAVVTPHDRYAWIAQQLAGAIVAPASRASWRARLDQVLLHPVAGLTIFLAVVVTIFQAIFTWALVPMGWIERSVTAAQSAARAVLGDGLAASFVADGVIAGVGSVVLFLPQIVILFFFIGLLEDSGYLARGAFLLDRLMHKIGLNGKAFVPLFSSFACAIPGIMATRTIEHRRERLITILVAPLMACSARLPVYTLITAALIPPVAVWGLLNLQGLIFVGLYLVGIVVAVAVSLVLKRLLRSEESSHFFLELPPYRLPQWRSLAMTLRMRAMLFLETAGSTILLLSISVWFVTAFPKPLAIRASFAVERQQAIERAAAGAPRAEALAQVEQRERAALLEASLAGRLGRWLEPAIRPLGFDWKIGVAIIASFAQREVFVSTLSIINSLGESGDSAALRQTLRQARDPLTQRPLYPPIVGLSILVFYVLACQCVSTLAVVRRETGSWRWPAVMFAYMTALAYVASLAVYQGGRWLGLG